MLSHMNEVDPFISAGFCMRCKNMFFQHKHAPMLHRDKRNTQKRLVQGKQIPTNSRKDKSANFELAHNCIKSFKSGAYLHTVEVKNMLSGNPKVGSSMEERFVHLKSNGMGRCKKDQRDEIIPCEASLRHDIVGHLILGLEKGEVALEYYFLLGKTGLIDLSFGYIL